MHKYKLTINHLINNWIFQLRKKQSIGNEKAELNHLIYCVKVQEKREQNQPALNMNNLLGKRNLLKLFGNGNVQQ